MNMFLVVFGIVIFQILFTQAESLYISHWRCDVKMEVLAKFSRLDHSEFISSGLAKGTTIPLDVEEMCKGGMGVYNFILVMFRS